MTGTIEEEQGLLSVEAWFLVSGDGAIVFGDEPLIHGYGDGEWVVYHSLVQKRYGRSIS